MKRLLTLFACICLALASLTAQDFTPLIKRYMLDNQQKLNLNKEVIADGWQISDQYLTEHNQVTQVYLQQMVNGLKLQNAISAVAVQKGAVKVFNSAFVADANRLANVLPGSQQLSAAQAIERAVANVEVSISNLRRETVNEGIAQESVFSASGDVKDPIKVSLVYQMAQEDIRLAWNVEFPSKSDWWHIRVDALTGAILDKGNYTVYCNFHSDAYHHAEAAHAPVPEQASAGQAPVIGQGYRVFPFPGESPIHTSHQLISDPSDAVASPYGWHDTNGQPGAEYTITRGNNVLASEDRDDNNQPGHSPDGGNDLIFDFPYNPVQTPVTWEDAAITNLFYANNIMHDITYHRGFDEGAGNFQQNNYGNGGAANDAVQADAQDGSGTDNANFSTPPDGSSGRMQMYIWTTTAISSPGDSIRVLSPAAIAGSYYAPTAQFGPAITAPITGEVVLIEDAIAPTSNGCDPLVNAAALAGKIVVVDRGTCAHVLKVQVAQEAGAIGVIIVHNLTSPPFAMPGSSSTINIPSVMISQADGQLLKDQLLLGPVTLSLLPPAPANSDRDSDLDNGIIAHEYGHGISTRLTGGPSNSGCLNNAEQMGEGWSDFFALLTTIRPNDNRFTKRPMGTYAVGETPGGDGIRNQLYSTDMAVNTYTYGDMSATGGETHNIGELWTTMLWDLTWDLIDVYGYNPDLTASTGGNNIAHQLVIDGMKLQKCNPGFVDGRDAILEADEIDYVGANKCIIWKAFARRGLGYSAKQGSSDSYTDGTQAFDIPPTCQIAVSAPIANFSVNKTNSCLELATFQFGDQSQNIAQEWLWDFGDGVTSTEPNPTHTYLAEGSYDVTLIVKNNIATDTLLRTAYITVGALPAPAVAGETICAGHSASLSITPTFGGNTAEWLDANGNVVYTGTTFNTPVLTSNTTYSVRESEPAPGGKVGPTSFGPGGNHNNTFIGQVLFTAQSAFTIKSVLVRAQGNGIRVVRLFDDAGNEISSVSVPVPNGDSRITLNLKVPGPGNYGLGAGPNINLYRNNGGTTYPFTIANLVTITGTNASQQDFYYYFYDWDVQKEACRSSATDVTVSVTPGPVAAFSSVRNGLSVTFSDQSTGNPTNWEWSFGDGNTSSVPSPTHTYATPGVYTVELTVTNGSTCSTVFTETIDFTSGTNNLNPDQFFVGLSPNPATGIATLSLSGELGGHLVQVGIYGADGRLMQSIPHDMAKSATLQLDLQDLAPGLYLVKVEAAVGTVVKKLLVH